MKTLARAWVVALAGLSAAGAQGKPAMCSRAVVEGEVSAGQSFERVFTPGLEFLLEPIASGWIVRVLPVGEPRGRHDYAELATPPYQSVTPLAIGTDYSFRAQDAVAWNPRRFRYVATAAEFREMSALYGPAVGGDNRAATALAELAAKQPEAELKILDAHFVPGTNDQARMAAMVASHFETTPHEAEAAGGSPLGKVTRLKFRVAFELELGMKPARGLEEEKIFCVNQTTAHAPFASQFSNPARNK